MPGHRIFAMAFARVYPLYVQKAERKNRTKAEVDRIIRWLTGYDQAGLQLQIEQGNDLETFFAQAPGRGGPSRNKGQRQTTLTALLDDRNGARQAFCVV